MEAKPNILALRELTPEQLTLANNLGANIQAIAPILITPAFSLKEVKLALQNSPSLLFTSYQAVEAISNLLSKEDIAGKIIYCVGNKTANFFNSYDVQLIKENDAKALSKHIKAGNTTQLTHFHGSRYLNIIENELLNTSIQLNKVEVYKNKLCYPIINNCENFNIILFFSPSGVESFLKHNLIPESCIVGAIGKTTASYINTNDIQIASEPTAEILIKESINYYKQHVNN